jgi:hypothetical protein
VRHVKIKMNKVFFIIVIFVICSCGQTIDKQQNDSDEVYKAKIDFGEVDNKIRVVELDSLINSIPVQRLNDYKTVDSVENIAFLILKKEINRQEKSTSGLLITKSEMLNDSVLVFTISHIDYFTYMYNRSKMDPEPPPITGNISGLEGWYYVDIKSETLNIQYEQ